MPISQKIKDRIEKLEATKDEKQLLLTMLEHEDDGIGWYKSIYIKEIKDFIEKTERNK